MLADETEIASGGKKPNKGHGIKSSVRNQFHFFCVCYISNIFYVNTHEKNKKRKEKKNHHQQQQKTTTKTTTTKTTKLASRLRKHSKCLIVSKFPLAKIAYIYDLRS